MDESVSHSHPDGDYIGLVDDEPGPLTREEGPEAGVEIKSDGRLLIESKTR